MMVITSYYQQFKTKKLVYPNIVCRWFKFRARLVDDTKWERMIIRVTEDEFHTIDTITKIAAFIHKIYPDTI